MHNENSNHEFLMQNKQKVSNWYNSYNKLIRNYRAAIREVKTKLEILDEDFELLHEHNPIHHMDSRIKSIESLVSKLEQRGLPITTEAITNNIFDIAGIRVICYYIEDIYTVAELLSRQTDITVIETKDYIKNPKSNGYRSLHLIVRVPVFFVDGISEMAVEVQIRTIAMDFWASLEHRIRYKAKGDVPQFISDELLECADAITASDIKMEKIHKFLKELDSFRDEKEA